MQPKNTEKMTSGAKELQALRRLAAAITDMTAAEAPEILEWNARAEALAESGDLEALPSERKLDELGFALRSAWLRMAHETSHHYLMAPPHEQPKYMPSGERFQFDYERSSRPELLERRGLAMAPPPKGWNAKCMLFTSGMSAIATLVQVCCAHLKGALPDEPAKLKMFGGYFETWRLLDMFHNPALDVEYLQTNAALAKAISSGTADALIIEPVAYDWDMTVFDVDAFAEAWRSAAACPQVVIVDTSLTGDHFGLDDILGAFGDRLPWMVLFVRSGLKLDHEGLELSNVGIVNIYVPPGKDRPFNFEHLKQRLTVNRAVTGGGLTVNDTAALEAPWFLSRDSFRGHAARVFENNRRLAVAVRNEGGIISRIGHPALLPEAPWKWAVAPFVVFHLADDTAGRHGLLVAILVYEARRRGLCFDLGSSFGFRGHRFEVIRPLVQIREWAGRSGLLKIAMGSRDGPSVDGVIALINDILGVADWSALKAAYPDVKPYVKGNFGVYVERPPRS